MIRSTILVTAALACSLAFAVGAMAAPAHITMARAKQEIVGDGYTGIANVHETKTGWEATALEGGKPVTVLVTNGGFVEKTQ